MNNTKEKWKLICIDNINTIYIVSNAGNVKNTITGNILKGHYDSKGYKIFNIIFNDKRYDCKAHRLVAEAFIPNPENKPTVNHKDGNKDNNWDWNLEWDTVKENINHAFNTGLMENAIKGKIGSKNPFSKYSEHEAESVCILYFNMNEAPVYISKELNVSIDFIKSIIYANAWKHISIKYKKKRKVIKMGKKKVQTIEDAVKIFKDIMMRASLSDYLYVNKTLISKNPKGNSVIIIPDQELWLKIIDHPEMKDHLKEIDVAIPDEYEKSQLLVYANEISDQSWVEIDPSVLFTGKIFKISISGFEYEVPINRGLLPLKLRKAEYNNISYRVFTKPNLTLSLKKRFDFPAVEECGFTVIRMFQVI